MSLCSVKNTLNIDPSVVPSTVGVSSGYILENVGGVPTWAAAGAAIGSITVNGTGPLTVTGSPVALGGTLGIYCSALDLIPTGCWGAAGFSLGTGSNTTYLIGTCASPASTTTAICIGAASTTNNNTIVLGHQSGAAVAGSTGIQNVYIGNLVGTAQTSVGVNNVMIGHLAGSTSPVSCTGCVMIGENVGAHTGTYTANDSVVVGRAAKAVTGTGSIAIGVNAAVLEGTAIAIGNAAKGIALSVAIGASAGPSSTGVGSTSNVAIGVNALNATGKITNTVAIGNGACRGAGGTFNTVIGDSAAPTMAGNDNVVIGYNSGYQLTAPQQCTIIGDGANCGTTPVGCVAVGQSLSCLSYGVAIGCASTALAFNSVVGYGASASNTIGYSTCLGYGSGTTANYTNTIGCNMQATVDQTTLIGDSSATPTNHVVISTGSFQSNKVYSTKVGRNSATQTVTFSGTTPVTLIISNTFWSNGPTVTGNNINLLQSGMQYAVSATALTSIVTGATAGNIVMRIRWYVGGVVTTIAETNCTTNTGMTGEIAWNCRGEVLTATSTSYVYCELAQMSGTTTSVTVSWFQFVVTRIA